MQSRRSEFGQKALALRTLQPNIGDKYEFHRQQLLQEVISLPVLEASLILNEFLEIEFVTNDEFNRLVADLLAPRVRNEVQQRNVVQNIGNVCTETILFSEMNIEDNIDIEHQISVAHVSPKKVKNILWLVKVLKSLEETLKSIDYEKTWKSVEDILAFLGKCTDVLLQCIGFVPPARPWALKIKAGIAIIQGIMNDPSRKKHIIAGLQKVVFFLLSLLSFVINELEGNPQKLGEFNEELGKHMKVLQDAFSTDIVRAIAATGGTAVAFVVGANLLLPILGFGANGIIAGSIAAGTMGSSVAAGSAFAMLQSAGVIGFGAVATGGMLLVGGAVGLTAFGIYKAVKEIQKKQEESNSLT